MTGLPVILSTAYLPNIQYFSKFLLGQDILIDLHETYLKQSYRNRAVIYGPNGIQNLTIPIKKTHGNQTKTKDIIIDYTESWQHIHWHAIKSAYKNSAFFELLEDEFYPLFKKEIKFLYEWNAICLDKIFDMMGKSFDYSYSDNFVPTDAKDVTDYRTSINPKKRLNKPDFQFSPVRYYQVFAEKHGFIENLSFIDLLFNEGPNALSICKTCIKTEIQ